MARLIFFLILALIPGLLWLYHFYRKDIYDPEPPGWVLGTFALGALAVIPASFLETILQIFWAYAVPTPPKLFQSVNFFLNVGPVEETLKFLAVYLFAYRERHFNEPVDGIIYASAAALGFATAENILYMHNMGWEVIFLRGFLTTFAHVMFACMWGMALGQARFFEVKSRNILLYGLLLSSLAHGLYDFIVASSSQKGAVLALCLLIGWMWFRIQRWIQWALANSPFAQPLENVKSSLEHLYESEEPNSDHRDES